MSNKVKVPGGAFYVGDGLTVDPVNRTVSAGGGDVTTPDWNQNDETASDYIKNRPGGYTSNTLDNTSTYTRTFTLESDGRYKTAATQSYNTSPFGIEQDVSQYSYDVIFNGVEYLNVPVSEEGHYYLGDYNLVDYPFCIDYRQPAGGGMVNYMCFANIGGEVEITVKRYVKSIVKIPANMVESPTSVVAMDTSYTANILKDRNIPANTYISVHPTNGTMNLENLYTISSKMSAGEYQPIRIIGDAELHIIHGNSNVEANIYTAIGSGYIILKSSTSGSSKKFKITVDDTGTLSVTEYTG